MHAWRDSGPRANVASLADEPLSSFLQMAEALDEIFWLYSVDPFCLLYCSSAAQRIWGFDPMIDAGDNSERHSTRMIAHIHPEDVASFAGMLVDLPFVIRECEYRIVRANGEVRWLRTRVVPVRDRAGVIYRIAGITEDITGRRQAEQELDLHRAFDRLMQDVSREFTSLTREQVDEGFRRALRDIASLLGAGCAAISLLDASGTKLQLKWRWADSTFGPTPFPETPFAPGDVQRLMLERLGVAQVGSVPELPDGFAETRDRLLRSGFRSMVNIALFSRGHLIGVLGFGSVLEGKIWPTHVHRFAELAGELFVNVIERLHNEDKTQRHRDQLAHVLRLGTMGQLAAGIAHELNQPLSAIVSFARGCVRRLSDEKIDRNELRETLEKINDQALRAGSVIRALRELVRADNHLSKEDVVDVVNSALVLIEPDLAAANVHLRIEADSELSPVQIDRIQVEQVILNLLKNACDALAIADAGTPREVLVTIRALADGVVEVSVADSGPGIDPVRASAIFDDFYTSKPGGLGLGLSISRAIVEAHGGRLWLESSSSSGSCFRFTLSGPKSTRVA